MPKNSDDCLSLTPPPLTWAEGTPVSQHYDDVYFSHANGLDETRQVFLSHNRLPQRWQHDPAGQNPRQRQVAAHFIIIECGFGTGLNFLASWQLWRRHAGGEGRHRRRLHYVSIEKHPLTAADIARSAGCWPELASYSERLCAAYPPPLPGLHALQLDDDLQLTLGFGDILSVLDQLCDCDHPLQKAATAIKADAWFLDGFAPSRNPQMWSDAVFERIAALSKAGTTFATYTAAGRVRRGLAASGFSVQKVPGYGSKRDMLQGTYTGVTAHSPAAGAPPARHRAGTGLAWHTAVREPIAPARRHAVVIGAGLAGCHTARALAESGWQVTVTERAEYCAAAASGNPAGLLYSRLSAGRSEQAEFYLASFVMAARRYRQLFDRGELLDGQAGALKGLLLLAFNAHEQRQLDALAARYGEHPQLLRRLGAAQAGALCGVAVDFPALLLAGGGWLDPGAVCRQLLRHPSIVLRTGTEVDRLCFQQQQWRLYGNGSELLRASACVICSGTDSGRFEQLRGLPIRAVGGQITLLAPEQRPQGTPDLQLPLCHRGYVTQLPDGRLCCGASFRVNDGHTELRAADDRSNLQTLAEHVPALLSPAHAARLGEGPLAGRASARCTSPDYLPIVGPVADSARLRQHFAALARDAKIDIPACGPMLDGLFVNTAHGSRGLSTTPIAAELIAAQLNGTPRPLPWQLVRALSPSRFVIRDLIKGKQP